MVLVRDLQQFYMLISNKKVEIRHISSVVLENSRGEWQGRGVIMEWYRASPYPSPLPVPFRTVNSIQNPHWVTITLGTSK